MTIIDDIYDISPNFVIAPLTFTIFGDIMQLVIVTKGVCLLDSITALIKNEIKSQYKSLSKFAEASGIPYSTLSNALSRGVGGTSYDTVKSNVRIKQRKKIPRKAFLLISVSLCLANARALELLSLRTPPIQG